MGGYVRYSPLARRMDGALGDAMPLQRGAIILTHTSAEHFTDNEARILERFAEAFSFGYTRFLDFRRLERRNRALQIGGAVANVQSAVAAMTSSADIVRVMTLITQELEALELDFTHCSISIFDEKGNKVRAYTALRPKAARDLSGISKLMVGRSHAFGSGTIDRIERGELVAVYDIPGSEDWFVVAVTYDYSDYLKRNPKTEGTVILSRTEEEARHLSHRWEDMYDFRPWPEKWMARSSMRCRFRAGLSS